MFITIIYLKNSTFLSLIIVDRDWCHEWNIKSLRLQVSYNKNISLSGEDVPVRFRAQQRAKRVTTAPGQLNRSYKVSPMLTDLRITNHRGHTFPPSLLYSFIQNSNGLQYWPQPQFFRTCKLFGWQGCSGDKKCVDFSRISQITSAFAVRFHSTRGHSTQV